MVIPLGGMGPPLLGPPPSSLAHRFRQMKFCVLVLFGCVVGALIGALMLGQSVLTQLINSFNVILNGVFGIFLLKDDPQMERVYTFLVTTICQSCQDQCPTGMQCLLPFVMVNAMTVVLNILLG